MSSQRVNDTIVNFSDDQREKLNAHLRESRRMADALAELGEFDNDMVEILESYNGDRIILQNIVDNVRSVNSLLSKYQRSLSSFYSKAKKRNNDLLVLEKTPIKSKITEFKELKPLE